VPATAAERAKAARTTTRPAKAARVAATEPAASGAVATAPRIQKLVNELRRSLSVTHDVSVELVADNPLKASVEPVKGSGNRFRLAIDRRFLEQLSPDELKAVVAHELGHVWIYTHFPYLQTEQLANQIAMRVVTRESLFLVYGKVWADAASAGSLPRFPEERPAAAAGLATPPVPRTAPEN
jgi:peptidase M48-like protein